MIATWQAPLPNGKTSEELLLSLDNARSRRVLILPALFDEANKMRRFTVEVMRQLDTLDVDSFLPDLPGCNESRASLTHQTIAHWRSAAQAACKQVSATHVLAIRAGALMAPPSLPSWHYAPQSGPKLLRGMLRARVIAAREDGLTETTDGLLEKGRSDGLVLAGWPIGAAMLRELETAESKTGAEQVAISQRELGGAGLWLRAEPDEDNAQSKALAERVAGQFGEAA